MSTSTSRAVEPLPKVTWRALPSRRASTTNPGASRRWTAPKSRTASQTLAGDVETTNSLRMDAIAHSLLQSRSWMRDMLGESCCRGPLLTRSASTRSGMNAGSLVSSPLHVLDVRPEIRVRLRIDTALAAELEDAVAESTQEGA